MESDLLGLFYVCPRFSPRFASIKRWRHVLAQPLSRFNFSLKNRSLPHQDGCSHAPEALARGQGKSEECHGGRNGLRAQEPSFCANPQGGVSDMPPSGDTFAFLSDQSVPQGKRAPANATRFS